jgi:hypothetical protein
MNHFSLAYTMIILTKDSTMLQPSLISLSCSIMLTTLDSSLATLEKCQLLSYDVEKYDAKNPDPGPG